ncbi:MAG: gamma-glutamyltransferase family protein [Oenococcus sp.]|uniref:gamma-glutamyltransferase family protein n=1 Tax=Oenococcus sp. TaxID=1979414 RepID=UPI0039EC9EB0
MSIYTNQFNPYARSRKPVYAKNGMVATSTTAAAQAGLAILKQGGNAIDAAVATAACQTVTEPTSNGIGADAFAIIHFQGKLYGLNGSGPSPKSLSLDALLAQGNHTIPNLGWDPVDVPGAPATWAALVNRFGKLSLAEDLAPAIDYAQQGYAVPQVLAHYWRRAYEIYQKHAAASPSFARLLPEWEHVFAPNGRTPAAGECWSSPDHANTLKEIVETNAESFYRGHLAEKIAATSQKAGGFLSLEDLAAYQPEWVDPISINYHGYDVFELPPNGQGIVALEALGILDAFQFATHDSVDTIHKQIEAIKLAFSDLFKFVGDPKSMTLPVDRLISQSYLTKRRQSITDTAALPEAGNPDSGGTVYLCTADSEGNMVSYIQSNYMGFGSGVVIPGTGIAMNDRGCNFSLDPQSADFIGGYKRPLNTIIPGFLAKDDQAIGPFGVMGGFMQPQGHVQALMNCIDFGMDPQGALDTPRWQWTGDKNVQLERTFPDALIQHLIAAGHHITINPEANSFGRGQIIWHNPQTGTYVGGSDSRTDGAVAAW